jgi:hypothetical protein
VAYPCEVAYETEVEAADTLYSFDGAPVTKDSLGTFSRMALMIAFIGHLYLANWLSHFKGLFYHVLNATSWRTDHHLLSHHSQCLPLKNFFTPLTPNSILNTKDDHFGLPLLSLPILYMTSPIACSVVASALGVLSRVSCLAASKVAAVSLAPMRP